MPKRKGQKMIKKKNLIQLLLNSSTVCILLSGYFSVFAQWDEEWARNYDGNYSGNDQAASIGLIIAVMFMLPAWLTTL